MSNPVTKSFGFCVGDFAVGEVTNVQVPSGTLSTALKVVLFGDQDNSSSKIYDAGFISNTMDILAVALDSVVPTGSTLRANVFNQTQNNYVGNIDIAAGSGGGRVTGGAMGVAAGDQCYLLLVDTAGSGFLIPRLQWYIQ